ncbi:MAG: outer membrane beta-barrel protein [Acidocella sp.]|nr:outer membrane beta-barrel protein [Acidocella sp.]
MNKKQYLAENRSCQVLRCGLAGAVAVGAFAAVPSRASAQLIQQYFSPAIPGYAPDFKASVVNRMNAQNTQAGVPVGSLVVRPKITESAGYNSDTLAVPHSGSAELESAAELDVNSNWAQNALGASVSVDNRRYFALPSAGYTNWSAGVGGSLNIGQDKLTLGYSRLALNLAATDLGVIGVVTPVPYSVNDARASYDTVFARFSLTPSFEYENFEFGKSTGSNVLNYNTLNHQVESGGITGRYDFVPGNAALIIIRGAESQFSVQAANEYQDIGAYAGLDFAGDEIIQYRALVGAETRHFAHSPSADQTIPVFEVNAVWTPTELDTVTLSGVRRFDDPTSPFARDQITLDGRVEIDHELRQNVFLTGYAEAARSTAQPSTPGEVSIAQTQVDLGVSALWNINQNLRGTLSYGLNNSTNNNRSINATTAPTGYRNFSSDTVLLGISLFE